MRERDWDKAASAHIWRHRRILRIEYKRALWRYRLWWGAFFFAIACLAVVVGSVVLVILTRC
jgi:hypothetical protein